ncbi:MAG TPA: DNA polymerase III subunit gamma/tau [Candidatus Borkfalkia stercoripullorum]|nr:DNA polymerase III subunit gamma/tau [Candidatus Borkfalkia stercoripullorum]
MSYQALYRTFRPTTLEGLVRQEHIVKILVNQIETDRIGHAYLFCGPRGTGKTSTAKIFAKAINCEHPVNGSPCGKCETCRALSDPSNLDITEIDAASNNGVNEMRDLREKVQYPPVAARYKVYIVDEVHMLSDSAFNALLKTLEEPPKHAVFILATTEPQKLPATILSRCMRFDFKLIPQKDLEEHIKRILGQIGKEYEDEAVAAIARAGAGSVRDSLSIADICISFSRGKLTYADVNEVLGSADFYEIAKLGEAVLSENVSDALTETERVIASGKGVGVLTKDILNFINNCSIAKSCRNANSILNLPEEMFAEISRIAENADGRKILRCAEIFTGIEADMRYSVSPRIIFETAIVKACMPGTDLDALSLSRRLDALEARLKSGAVSAPSAGQGVVSKEERPHAAPVLESAPYEEAPFDAPPPPPEPEADVFSARRAPEKVNALDPDKRKGAFGYFMRSLRSSVKNGVLFTMCQDLEPSFEGDKFILAASSEVIYRSLNREEHYKSIASVLANIGITDFEIRLKGAKADRLDEDIARLKKDFAGTDIKEK